MYDKIKLKIDQGLLSFLKILERKYQLRSISPLLARHITEFVLRDGKRTRPILFVTGYLGFSKHLAPNLYISALAIEIMHDFMLVHDDIIDKSDQRRGKPSLHKVFNTYLATHNKNKDIKFSGQDLALIAGDIMYAISIEAFLSIKEHPLRKEKALQELIKTATYTGCGQFIELLSGLKKINEIKKSDIYKIYDLKTARYTFASPLSIGAILAGANQNEVKTLFNYGLYLGRAFQIKDDIIGVFGKEKETGKPITSDIQEAKKTLLIWYAYNHSPAKAQRTINEIFLKTQINKADLGKISSILVNSGSLDFAKEEIRQLQQKADRYLEASKINAREKIFLQNFSRKILAL